MKSPLAILGIGLLGLLNMGRAEGLVFHQAPKAAVAGAVAADWPRFLGPEDNASSPETRLLKHWGEGGPRRVWEYAKGGGHACPAISGQWLVLFHREGDLEKIDCLDRETGRLQWAQSYSAPYRDRYGSGDGPRSNPVIADGRVFVFGITGWLHCLDLKSGKVLWKRDLQVDYQLRKNFFGHGSTPVVAGGRVMVNVSGAKDVCMVALDVATGLESGVAKHAWGASYASPVAATLHGRPCVLVFAGGESRPPVGGLLCIEQATGKVLNETPHRARIAESVNASSPVVIGEKVLVSEAYGSGGELVEIGADFSARSLWKAPRLETYFMTAVARGGYLYGFSGQHSRLSELVCYEVSTGKEVWRNELEGKFGRGSLLAVDGKFLCLGENGDLAWLDLSPEGARVLVSESLFQAPESWTLPALSHGLLYVCQNERDAKGNGPRVICYDLREAGAP